MIRLYIAEKNELSVPGYNFTRNYSDVFESIQVSEYTAGLRRDPIQLCRGGTTKEKCDNKSLPASNGWLSMQRQTACWQWYYNYHGSSVYRDGYVYNKKNGPLRERQVWFRPKNSVGPGVIDVMSPASLCQNTYTIHTYYYYARWFLWGWAASLSRGRCMVAIMRWNQAL